MSCRTLVVLFGSDMTRIAAPVAPHVSIAQLFTDIGNHVCIAAQQDMRVIGIDAGVGETL